MPGELLARLDPDRQMVLLRRQGAGRVGSEGARRTVRLVEVQDDPAVLRSLAVEEPPRSVGLLAARPVTEDVEELLRAGFLQDWLEAELPPAEREGGVARTGKILGLTQDV